MSEHTHASPTDREQSTSGGQDPNNREDQPRYVQTTAPMVLSEQAYDDIRAVIDQTGPLSEAREISDATARTIAGWFASSGRIGRELGSLATGCRVELGALLYDVTTAREEHPTLSPIDHRALDCLATWALQSAREDESGAGAPASGAPGQSGAGAPVGGAPEVEQQVILACGSCSADVIVSRANWLDLTTHELPHDGCPDGGGVDLAFHRRHSDSLFGRVGGTATFAAELLPDGSAIFLTDDGTCHDAPKLLADTFRMSL